MEAFQLIKSPLYENPASVKKITVNFVTAWYDE